MSLLRRLGILAFAAVAPAIAATPGASFQAEFVAAYCVTCHSGDEPKGGLLIAEVARARSTDEDLEQWRRASEYVASGTMPPAGVRQPTAGERERFAASVRAGLERGAPVTPPARAVARRLNRTEYLNTLRDLLAIREIRLPVTFPDDNPDLRFDTMAEGTHLSPGHLDSFQEVAIDIADRLVPLPYRSEWTSAAARGTVGQDPSRTKFWTREGDERGLYFTGVNIAGWSGALWDRAFAAPASGVYRVRLKVSAEAASGADGKPLRLGFYAVNPSDYDLPKRALRADLPLVGSVEVASESPSWIEADVLLERGESFHIYCENRLTKQYPDALVRTPGNTDDLRRLLARYLQEAQDSPEPTIRFEGMDVRGPVGPLPRQVQFLGGGPASLDRAYLESILLPLAERAFRRPLGAGEGRQLIDSAIEHGAAAPAPEYAVHFGVRRILLSPQFLYRELGAGDLGEFGLASRLSYFLWSTMPDEELLRLAGDGRLSDPEVLRRQVRRMVRHPKAQQFVQHFSGQWLGGREAAAVMVCDVRHVWSELIRHGIVRSTEMFFDEILQRNRSIRSFVDSDFTYANEPMRIAWGMPGSEVDLRRLEADQRQSLLWPEPTRLDLASLGPEVPRHVASRGGALGLSSVLAATGDGVESSPILRGVWVLENLLGTPPPPPPSDVPALVADTSKARTVREVLAAHQKVETCAVCHVRIDPFGLALEHYDAVGGWRDAYYVEEGTQDAPIPVDSSSEMADGTNLDGAQAIKDYLMERPERFTRALAGLLLEYATGREPDEADRIALDEIVAAEPEGGYGFRDLIARLAESEAFAVR